MHRRFTQIAADGKPMTLLKVAAGLIVLPFDNVRKREAIADIGDCWPCRWARFA